MKNPRIGCDLDNTIVGFDEGYYLRFGNWPKKDWCITRNVNNILINEKAFWLGLPIIRRPDFTPACYCSVRISNHRWTKEFLRRNNLPEAKLYQIKGGWGTSKYDILKNKVDVFIDDSIYNFEDLNDKGILCLLITSKSNVNYQTKLRIDNLKYSEILCTLN